MPRVKDARDWLLTWSPEEGVSQVPEVIQEWLDGSDVRRYYAVCETSGKQHIHIAFSTYVTYNSDYKWWVKIFEKFGFKAPALDIKYHNNIIVCAGGYFESTAIKLGSKGFTEEQIQYGRDQYALRSLRQRVRTFANDHIVVSRDKFQVVIGAIMAEASCGKEEAIEIARDAGFAFGTSTKGGEDQYAEIYRQREAMS